MKKLLIPSLIVAALSVSIITVSSCEKAVEPAPAQDCSTSPKTYTKNVKSIMDTYCKVCHQPGGSYASIPLTSYAEVKNATQNGKLLNSIKHDGTASAMPQGGNKLSDADIAIVQCWVDSNYPE